MMENLNSEQMKILEPYMVNEMNLLKKITLSILNKTDEEVCQADYDDFYSIANETVLQTIKTYNPKKKCMYNTYLYKCISNNIKTEIRNRHRFKRWINYIADPFYCTDDESFDMLYKLDSGIDVHEEATKKQKLYDLYNEIKYNNPDITEKQLMVLFYKVNGYKAGDIQKILGITAYEYNKINKSLKKIKL